MGERKGENRRGEGRVKRELHADGIPERKMRRKLQVNKQREEEEEEEEKVEKIGYE